MQESFLHFIWRTRRFDSSQLSTTTGQSVVVLHPGEYNANAGPDFFNARIRIDETEWAGNIEMHLNASEWYTHRHQHDPAYQNVVLHVVWDNDKDVLHTNGSILPTLIMKDRVSAVLVQQYEHLLQEEDWIPCSGRLREVPDIIKLNWLDRLLVERLEQKTSQIAVHLNATANHWEEAFYRLLARSYGLKVNTEPFESLARSLPLLLLAKHKNDLPQIEALLFGQAGLLEGEFSEAYPRFLAKEYRFLKHKYSITPISGSQWKFLRMRPANFPTIRIAQFAALIYHSTQLFGQILEAPTARHVSHLFSVAPGPYWDRHYRFDIETVGRVKTPGRDFIDLVLINTIIPTLFYYGKVRQIPAYTQKALRWLEELSAENNHLLQGWALQGVHAKTAYESQALLQLKSAYCDKKRCLECAIGNQILRV